MDPTTEYSHFLDGLSKALLLPHGEGTGQRQFARRLTLGTRDAAVLLLSMDPGRLAANIFVCGALPGGNNAPTSAAAWCVHVDRPTVVTLMKDVGLNADDEGQLHEFIPIMAEALGNTELNAAVVDEEPLQCAVPAVHPKLQLHFAYRNIGTGVTGVLEVRTYVREPSTTPAMASDSEFFPSFLPSSLCSYRWYTRTSTASCSTATCPCWPSAAPQTLAITSKTATVDPAAPRLTVSPANETETITNKNQCCHRPRPWPRPRRRA